MELIRTVLERLGGRGLIATMILQVTLWVSQHQMSGDELPR
jgi:hypothetical protein